MKSLSLFNWKREKQVHKEFLMQKLLINNNMQVNKFLETILIKDLMNEEIDATDETKEELQNKKEKKKDEKNKKSKLEKENEDLKNELANLKNEYLKVFAEMENTKKRLKEDAIKDRKYASQKVVGELVQPVDMLVQIVNMPAANDEVRNYQIGFQMIANQLVDVLKGEA